MVCNGAALKQKSTLSPHRSHKGHNECFDDFGITQEHSEKRHICFSAGPLTVAQALSIQAVASSYCCLYSPRSD